MALLQYLLVLVLLAGLGTVNYFFQENFKISGHFSGHQNHVLTLK